RTPPTPCPSASGTGCASCACTPAAISSTLAAASRLRDPRERLVWRRVKVTRVFIFIAPFVRPDDRQEHRHLQSRNTDIAYRCERLISNQHRGDTRDGPIGRDTTDGIKGGPASPGRAELRLARKRLINRKRNRHHQQLAELHAD